MSHLLPNQRTDVLGHKAHPHRVTHSPFRLTSLFFLFLTGSVLPLISACGNKNDPDLQFCMSETNRHRATLGKPAVKHSVELERFSSAAARVDATNKSPHSHFRNTNGGGISRAQNEIPGWLGWNLDVFKDNKTIIEEGLKMMMAEGPGGGHYENIIGNYTEIGCGIFVNGKEVTVVQDFR